MNVFKQIAAAAMLMLWAMAPEVGPETVSEKAIKALENFFKFDVPYVPTPPEVVTAMLELAGTGPDEWSMTSVSETGGLRLPLCAISARGIRGRRHRSGAGGRGHSQRGGGRRK